jgi:hypothetical protein
MVERRAEVPTASASRTLQQLCKHWSHKFAVDFTSAHGEIALPFGSCVLDADTDRLVIVLSPDEGADVAEFQAVVERHVDRFAFRETLTYAWIDREDHA